MFEGLLQPMHLLVIVVILLLLFGPRKLPDLGRGLGDGIREFKNAMRGDTPNQGQNQNQNQNQDKPQDPPSVDVKK